MDEIERRIRGSRPDIGTRHDPLTPRAEAELLAITRAPAPKVRRARRSLIAIPSLAAALAAGIVVVSLVQAPQASMAAAPPPLDIRSVVEPLDVVIGQLRAATAALPAADGWPQEVSYEGWFSQIYIDEDATSHFVQPSEVTRRREADGSGTLVTRAGDVRWGTPAPNHPVPERGTVLESLEFGPDAFPVTHRTPPPSTAVELRGYLAEDGAVEGATAGEIFGAIARMADEWRLDGPQTAAVLQLIGELPGVTVGGEVTDRLGRDGIALQTETRAAGSFRDTLVFDATTGRLLSVDEMYLGGIPDFDLPFPTVFAYTAWKAPECATSAPPSLRSQPSC